MGTGQNMFLKLRKKQNGLPFYFDIGAASRLVEFGMAECTGYLPRRPSHRRSQGRTSQVVRRRPLSIVPAVNGRCVKSAKRLTTPRTKVGLYQPTSNFNDLH